MDQMTSHDPRPKILEHSLTLHPETFLLNTTEITVQSREEQAKPVCASGTLGWGLQLHQSDPSALTHHWRGSHLSLKGLFILLVCHRIQLPWGHI